MAQEGATAARERGPARKSNLQINAEISFRYYFPHFFSFPFSFLAQVGADALYNWASATYAGGMYRGTLSSDNLIIEVPILLGGNYTLVDRHRRARHRRAGPLRLATRADPGPQGRQLLAVTNPGRYEHLAREPGPKDANFWRPLARAFRLQVGTSFLFMLKAPWNAIAPFRPPRSR